MMKQPLHELHDLHASENTKKDTLAYVMKHQNRTRFVYGKRVAAVLCTSLIVMFTFIFFQMRNDKTVINRPTTDTTVIAYVSLDINPSLELQINKDEQVIQVVTFNKEARKLTQNMGLEQMNIKDAIEKILNSSEYQKYLRKGLLEVGIYADDTKLGNKLNIQMEEYLNTQLDEQQYHCSQINQQTHEEAIDHHTSGGKYRVIEEIMQYDERYTLDELKRMNMQQLYDILKVYDANAVPEGCMNSEKQHKNRHHMGGGH